MGTEFEIKEKQFEADIEASLCSKGGYTKGDPAVFDRKLALDKSAFISFIKTTQPKEWEKCTTMHGADTERYLVERFCHEVKLNGLLYVLRYGFTDRGVKLKAVFWKPETSMNATSLFRYEHNILNCTRQLHYCPNNENSVDIVLFLNGIPVVSMELKCQFTGQDATHAINQYKFDRSGKDPIFIFKERVLVHFAVDLENVYMTTKLAGPKTYFMPFNQGSNGAGKVGGKGNPVNPNGYQTAYLWEKVLCKDMLLELLQKFMHLQVNDVEDPQTGKTKKTEIMIFPRYHQLDVVTKILADVKAHGAGQNYLIEHSAGSGKSNSIAWLAHRLTGLHNDQDEKIFQSVIIVTDRRVLDHQLQETVYQFDHVPGLVVKVDKNSQQLKDAIENGAGIIITTLQKFPVIYKDVKTENKRFAVIVDEAHSSQTGEAAKKLKLALADTDKILEEYAKEDALDEETQEKMEDKLLEELGAQGRHDNLSFFAFTATPKDKTLHMFGIQDAQGKYHPYHIYSMRQAIDEGFILNVLQNYMTYTMYYKIAKTIADNPELDSAAGTKAILKYESLHPHNIAQKTAIMLEHFRKVTMQKIGGRAKAMVVTPSRLHAVRYYQEFKRQMAEKHYQDMDILVAFSGTVKDKGLDYTEEGMNKNKKGETIKQDQLPAEFKTDEFSILIVADKYQTGFDEPLLHTMFVDKKLYGVKAVQTLSRLNRTMQGKEDTFVLDFVNTAEDIQESFKPYFEETVLEKATDPNVVYDLKGTLDKYQVIRQDDVDRYAEIFYAKTAPADALGKLQALLKPAVDRYNALPEADRELFKNTLSTFIRIYSFITQVDRLFDKELHKYSVYAKYLRSFLPRGPKEIIDLDKKVLLEYYKLEKTYDGIIVMEPSAKGFDPISGETGRRERKRDHLEVLIENVNKKFGTNFTDMDKVLLQLENAYVNDPKWQGHAKSSDIKTFMTLFNKEFPAKAADRYEQNDEFFKKLFNEPGMMEMVMAGIGNAVYERLRSAGQHT